MHRAAPGAPRPVYRSHRSDGHGISFLGYANTGFPVDFIYPKEGAPILLASACPIAKPKANPLAQELIKTLISPEVQTLMAKEMGNGPVNTKVDVNMPELRMAPVGERAKLVVTPDWDVINAHREEWTKRWNREVER